MKILIISNNYSPYFDGISIFTNNLVSQLKKNGHVINLLNFDKQVSGKNLSWRDFIYTKSTFHSYYSPIQIMNPNFFSHPDKGLRNFVFTNMVYRVSNKVIIAYKPDIIHIIYPRLFSAIYSTQIPVISSVYSEEVRNTYPVKQLIRKSNKIIAISKYTANLVQTVDNVSIRKTTVIPCSIDINSYKINNNVKKNYILSIGRLSQEKNFDSTIKAFALLPNKIKEIYRYVIIGNGKEKENLENLIKKLKLQNSVTLLGNLSEKEKIRYLQQSKYFILCPRIKKGEQEGFGIVYLEAQASGLPIVTSQIGGIREAVGKGGLYISDPENSQEIKDALLKLILDEDLVKHLVYEGNKRIHSFDHNHWINQVLTVYKEALK
ncbi:MAG TPA: glycosyltransferase family 4 protein [Candidatus Woesebacteria bacterium]|nr:glycosyltransferase family 4 protein [Candidatus Woesebacteria bacterium]